MIYKNAISMQHIDKIRTSVYDLNKYSEIKNFFKFKWG